MHTAQQLAGKQEWARAAEKEVICTIRWGQFHQGGAQFSTVKTWTQRSELIRISDCWHNEDLGDRLKNLLFLNCRMS